MQEIWSGGKFYSFLLWAFVHTYKEYKELALATNYETFERNMTWKKGLKYV